MNHTEKTLESLLAQIDPQIGELDVPETLKFQSIEKYFNLISTSWEMSTQLILPNGEPYARTFNQLEFTPGEYVELTDLGEYDDRFESDKYYQVKGRFSETRYSSSGDFYQWLETQVNYEWSSVYTHKVISRLTWVQPQAKNPLTNQPIVDADNKPLYNAQGPLFFPVSAGKALGATVECSDPITVYLSETPNLFGTPVNGLILLTEPYLNLSIYPNSQEIGYPVGESPPLVPPVLPPNIPGVPFNPPPVFYYRPVTFTVTFYGEYRYTDIQELSEPEDLEVRVHPPNTPTEHRYTPPGIEVDDNFPQPTPITDLPQVNSYTTRKVYEPVILSTNGISSTTQTTPT